MNKFKKVVNERFDGVKDSKALSKKEFYQKYRKKIQKSSLSNLLDVYAVIEKTFKELPDCNEICQMIYI